MEVVQRTALKPHHRPVASYPTLHEVSTMWNERHALIADSFVPPPGRNSVLIATLADEGSPDGGTTTISIAAASLRIRRDHWDIFHSHSSSTRIR